MNSRNLVTLILALALAVANAAPLSAVMTCGMTAEAGCACDHGACCPDETAGPRFEERCCTVELPDATPVDVAPAPSASNDDLGHATTPPALGAPDETPPDLEHSSAGRSEPPPDESPPRYALFCTYLN